MRNNQSISDLSGIAIITHTAGNSLLCTGDSATQRPFEQLLSKDFDLRMGIPVSEKQYDKAARNPWNMEIGGRIYTTIRKPSSNSIMVNTKSVIKHIEPIMFTSLPSNHTVTEVTGKKAEWKGGKPVYPQLSVEEQMFCIIGDWAHSMFGTLKNVSVTVSLNNGMNYSKKF